MLRVMTLNIWNLSGPWGERRDEIVAWIDHLGPDVVCLQEVVASPDGKNQAHWLAEAAEIDYDIAYAGVPLPGAIGEFGNAVLSRWPIDASASAPLGHPDDVQRSILHARTRSLDVFSTHLNWRFDDGAAREQQVQEVAAFVDMHADPASPLPPMLAGDFNAEPDATEVRFLTGRTSLGGRSVYYQDAWAVAGGSGPGWTWDNRNPFAAADREPDRRIDYVFVGWRRDGGAGRIDSARVVCDRALTGIHASDHFGVLAEVDTVGVWS